MHSKKTYTVQEATKKIRALLRVSRTMSSRSTAKAKKHAHDPGSYRYDYSSSFGTQLS